MPIEEKFDYSIKPYLRDARPWPKRAAEVMAKPETGTLLFGAGIAILLFIPPARGLADFFVLLAGGYVWWLLRQPFNLRFKLPADSGIKKDPRNQRPGSTGKAEGILYLGVDKDNKGEVWLTKTDATTHILFLGTTGSGKTEGLKGLAANTLCWGSGFVFVDGKADTDVWAALYALVRRFGRDDDLLVLNYMTGNTDVFDDFSSNSFNPFSFGSSSFLSNMLVNMMPEAGGDNAMWKERAVALIFALMPALVWKRDKEGMLLDVGVVREHIELKPIVRLSRDRSMPERVVRGLQMYLLTLPGYVDAAFDDEGNERPPSPDQPMYDMQVARQQHGYLSMQFTRSLQSLADEYGYIFKKQLADIDVIDVVLNRRILVVLVPALEKSGEEAANLGKIVASSLKGMMGSTLGAAIEGSYEKTIETKSTRAPSPYMTIFDEVGYYTVPGMAVMAAQARSLGFSLVFAAQDLPSMEKRIKQEARSIAGNCNLKIFGKLEDPMETAEYFEKVASKSLVMEMKGTKKQEGGIFSTGSYYDTADAGLNTRSRASYDSLRRQKEGEVHMTYAEWISAANLFYAKVDKVRAMRVQKLLQVPPGNANTQARERVVGDIALRLGDSGFSPTHGEAVATTPIMAALRLGWDAARADRLAPPLAGAMAAASAMDWLERQQITEPEAAMAATAALAAAAGGGNTDFADWQPEPPEHIRPDQATVTDAPAAAEPEAQRDFGAWQPEPDDQSRPDMPVTTADGQKKAKGDDAADGDGVLPVLGDLPLVDPATVDADQEDGRRR